MTSYKQCTNNVKDYPLKGNCQNNRNFDVCPPEEKVNEKKFFKEYKKNVKIYPNFGKNATRVNMFTTGKQINQDQSVLVEKTPNCGLRQNF
jgi:hypothetical protein